jgi:hypothetical protein
MQTVLMSGNKRPRADIARLSVQQAENRTAFKLKDASIRGEAMLITDPQRWQEMEDEHVVSRVIKNIN